ncbi:class I SAM-dependent methyltransferase [Maridesulfovibrio sp.]|uniref:class I SAM-dependent methyltransferase n=1 Tax=Maridesulfovibrio sp. TaxID=2795000 RepID=UPI0029F4C24D|nr:class I SAM-dependent methyltransferase [Maridesulfovibrio sp.]
MFHDKFIIKAKEWDSNPERLRIIDEFAAEVEKEVDFSKDSEVLDFGCGTGLVGLRFGKKVKTLYALDTSEAMLGMLQAKLENEDYGNVRVLSVSMHESGIPENSLDAIFTSMAMHHVADLPDVLQQMVRLLKSGGKLIVGELLPEDGSFHGDNVVPYNGFEPDELAAMVTKAGFSAVSHHAHGIYSKPDKEGVVRQYGTFVLVGQK